MQKEKTFFSLADEFPPPPAVLSDARKCLSPPRSPQENMVPVEERFFFYFLPDFFFATGVDDGTFTALSGSFPHGQCRLFVILSFEIY